jgi:hypothetical protein
MRRAATGRVRLTIALATALVALAACSDDGGQAAEDGSSERSSTTEANGAEASGTEAWRPVAAPASCRCSDGSPYNFWVREGDPQRVVFFLAGGGACFSAETCGPANPTFTRNLAGGPGSLEQHPGSEGIFDFEREDNPFRDHSVVYVPYCTGDLHLGDATKDYGDGVVVHHNGVSNASTALAATAALFPDAEQLVVAGASAGSAGAPMYGGLASDVLRDAEITILADGSGAFPPDEGITTAIGGLWGTHTNLPPWPESEGEPVAAWNLPGLFVQTARHAPDVTAATINSAYDETQAEFVELIGLDDDLLSLIDANAQYVESRGVEVASWVNAGDMHTVLMRPELYTLEEGGTSLLDWVTDLVAGEDVEDVHCEECA